MLKVALYIYTHISNYRKYVFFGWGRNSSVDIEICYGLDGPGIESRCGGDFPHPFRPALGPTQSPVKWVPVSFPGVKRSVCGIDYPPHLAQRLKKEQRYISTPPLGLHGLFKANFTFTYIYFYYFFKYSSQDVTCQRC